MESLKLLRNGFNRGITKSIEFRKHQLKSIFNMLDENEKAFCDALYKDLHKSECEAKMSELLLVKQEISYLLKNMDTWLADEKVPKTFLTLTDSTWVQRQPFGVALCISTWNYPVQLNLIPLVGLVAAGNCVLLKPSEIATNTVKLLADLIPKYVDEDVCRVELGGPEKTAEILKQRFDFIMFTGGSRVGKIVMEAAAKYLTPVTLELGGKSPTYIDNNVEMHMTVKRLIWGKFLCAGQTCLAPDYLLIHKDVKEKFVEMALSVIKEFYGDNPKTSNDYPRIINKTHFLRLMDLILGTKGKILTGGEGKEEECYIAPTLIAINSRDDILMKDEIFGPIMPILAVDSADEAISIINDMEKPLAVYMFSNSKSVIKSFEDRTTSGAMVINDCVVHCGVKGLPFGGVGNSGIGSYHGRYSIEQFSHKRAVLDRDTKEIVNNLFRYPPYNEKKISWVEWGLKSDSKDQNRYCHLL